MAEKVTVGNVKKCPSCGAEVGSMAAFCPECGHEFNSVEANDSVKRLSEQIQSILYEQLEKSNDIKDIMTFKNTDDIKNDRICSLIRNFPIPTTKGDLLEFITYAVPQAIGKGGDYHAIALRRAWKDKSKEAILKAKYVLKDDPSSLLIISEYDKQLGKFRIPVYLWILFFLFAIPLIIGLLLSNDTQNRTDNNRLEEEIISDAQTTTAPTTTTTTTVSAAPMVYSCGFDGFVNMREEASFNSNKVGVFRNGPDGAELLEDLGDWKKINVNGLVGYVPSVYVQDTPTIAYNGTATADWMQGAWYNDDGAFLFLYNNGTWVHGTNSASSYGVYLMQNNEVKFIPAWRFDYSSEFSEILSIDMDKAQLGDYKKSNASQSFKDLRLNFNQVLDQLNNHTTASLLKGADNSSSPVSTSASSSGNSSSKSGNDWDAVLDSYESYCDRLASCLKKVNNGDLSAMTEYARLMKNCEDYLNKLEKAEGELTPAQINRLNRIHQKQLQSLQ